MLVYESWIHILTEIKWEDFVATAAGKVLLYTPCNIPHNKNINDIHLK